MSLPPSKRFLSNANSSSSSLHFQPPMKKATSQAVACSLDPNKNGLQHHHNQDDNDVVFDPSSISLDDDSKSDDAPAPATANLSRKKATPPQPAKKLVIKLVKGWVSFFLISFDYFFAFVKFIFWVIHKVAPFS